MGKYGGRANVSLAVSIAVLWVFFPPITVQWRKRVLLNAESVQAEVLQLGFPLPDRMDASSLTGLSGDVGQGLFSGSLYINIVFWTFAFALLFNSVMRLFQIRLITSWLSILVVAALYLASTALMVEHLLAPNTTPPVVLEDLGYKVCFACAYP